MAIFYDSPNRQIKVLAKFSRYTVGLQGYVAVLLLVLCQYPNDWSQLISWHSNVPKKCCTLPVTECLDCRILNATLHCSSCCTYPEAVPRIVAAVQAQCVQSRSYMVHQAVSGQRSTILEFERGPGHCLSLPRMPRLRPLGRAHLLCFQRLPSPLS